VAFFGFKLPFLYEDLPDISHRKSGKDDLNFFGNKRDLFFEEDEELPQYVLDGIKRGQKDAAAGRTITLDKFKKRLSSFK
jgi:hypothetical protein